MVIFNAGARGMMIFSMLTWGMVVLSLGARDMVMFFAGSRGMMIFSAAAVCGLVVFSAWGARYGDIQRNCVCYGDVQLVGAGNSGFQGGVLVYVDILRMGAGYGDIQRVGAGYNGIQLRGAGYGDIQCG